MIPFNPETISSSITKCAFSADGKYFAAVYQNSPYLSIYKKVSGVYTKLDNPATLPTGTAWGCAFSGDGVYLAVTHSTSPFLTIYKRTGDTFVKLSNPSTLPPTNANRCSFTSDGVYLAVAHAATSGVNRKVTVYKRSGDTFTALSALSGMPAGEWYDYSGRDCAFAPNGAYLAIAISIQDSTTLIAYSRSGDSFTKLTGPALTELSGQCCSISSDSVYMAVGNGLAPLLSLFKRSGSAISRLTNPSTMPTGRVDDITMRGDAKFLALVNGVTSTLMMYSRSGDAFSAMSLPTGVTTATKRAAFSPDQSLFACMPNLTSQVLRCYGVHSVPQAPAQSSVVDATNSIVFSWDVYSDITSIWPQTQLSAKLRWRPQGQTNYTEINISGSTKSYTMPGNTLSTDFVEWQVVIEYESGNYTSGAEWVTITTVDATPQKPQLISPANEYVETDKPIEFEWAHIIGSGTEQTKADLQYSVNNGEWVDLITVDGSGQTVTIDANTIPGGNVRWRARTYNLNGVAGEWAEPVMFMAVGAPATPVISAIPGDVCRPLVIWQAEGQLAFQMMVSDTEGAVVYTSGTVNSGVTNHRVTSLLEDGQYMVRIRVQNAYLLWSAWGAASVVISTEKPEAPTLTAESVGNGVKLGFDDVDVSATSLIVYRDGQPIAQLPADTAEWSDYSGIGESEYFVRLLAGDVFADSDTVSETPQINGRIIAEVAAMGAVINLKYQQGERPVQNYYYQSNAVLTKFEGRPRPCGDRPDAANMGLTINATVRTGQDFDTLLALADGNTTILYRDTRGRKMFGIIEDMSFVEGPRLTDVTLHLQATDYDEVINIA